LLFHSKYGISLAIFVSFLPHFHFILAFSPCEIPNSMSKRSNTSNEAPPPKCAQKPGFRFARPVSDVPQPSSLSSSAWFVTLQKERCGSLKALSRVLSSTLKPLTTASAPMRSPIPQTPIPQTWSVLPSTHTTTAHTLMIRLNQLLTVRTILLNPRERDVRKMWYTVP
jgi:hypothetical protein